ncbi:hypothetical protein G7046_g1886 [Stylonectria norvegica]|nr:hypothetical protein G7046_g1886 [Stylonectria norvegica]
MFQLCVFANAPAATSQLLAIRDDYLEPAKAFVAKVGKALRHSNITARSSQKDAISNRKLGRSSGGSTRAANKCNAVVHCHFQSLVVPMFFGPVKRVVLAFRSWTDDDQDILASFAFHESWPPKEPPCGFTKESG